MVHKNVVPMVLGYLVGFSIIIITVIMVGIFVKSPTIIESTTNHTEEPEPFVNFKLMCPTVAAYSGDVEENSIINLLPCSGVNTNCESVWNAASFGIGPDHFGNVPVWVIFDFGKTVLVNEFQFSNSNDTVHDTTISSLQSGPSVDGPWNTIIDMESTPGTRDFQSFKFTTKIGRYFKWYISSTASEYQPYVRCVNFSAYQVLIN